MSDFKQKFLRRLKHKARQINKEYKETLQIYNSAKVGLVTGILEYCEEHKITSPLKDGQEDKAETTAKAEEIFSEKEVRDVYKKIAISTHPDKFGNLNEEDKEEKASLFKKAAEAKDTKNLNELTQIASELKINLHELKYTQLELLEQQVEEKQKKIDEMTSDIAWRWYFLSPEEQKKAISAICREANKGV